MALTLSSLLGVGQQDSLLSRDANIAAPKVLSNAEDLSHLPSRIAKVRDDLVGPKASSRLCPAELESGDWIVLCIEEYSPSDLLDTAIAAVKAASNEKTEPQVVLATPTLLLTLLSKRTPDLRGNDAGKRGDTAFTAAFNDIVAWGIQNNASDATLNCWTGEEFSQIHFTIEGRYVAPPRWSIPTARMREILNVAYGEGKGGQESVFNAENEGTCRIEVVIDAGRVVNRFASLAADRGPSVTLRFLRMDRPVATSTLEAQGFLPSQISMFRRAEATEGGAIVLAGIFGSGKSTAIATLLVETPSTKKIITLEDPVEYVIPNAIQNTISRNLKDDDEPAFNAKLGVIKRSAPHIVLIGEIRERASAKAFMDMAGAGVNVLTTTHAKSAFQIPERLASEKMGIPLDFLASPGTLNLLAYQALISKLCPHCSLPFESLYRGGPDAQGIARNGDYWKAYAERIERVFQVDATRMKIKRIGGCPKCERAEIPELSGYDGRTVVAEMIEPSRDSDILRLIRAGDTIGLHDHMQAATRTAFDDPDMTNKSLMECAIYKACIGQIDPRDVEARTRSFETVEIAKAKAGRQTT